MFVLPDTVDCRECMTCEKLAMHAQDGSYFCAANGQDVDCETVDDFRAPVWCPDLTEIERFCVSLL